MEKETSQKEEITARCSIFKYTTKSIVELNYV